MRRHRRVELEAIGTGHRSDAAVDAPDPRDHRAVAEADDQLHAHGHPAAIAGHDAKDVSALAVDGHQIDHGDAALFGLELRLEDQRPFAVAAADLLHSAGRRQQPAAIFRRSKERREERIRVEARETEPVDRPVLGDEREAAEVGDDGVVFDARRHRRNVRRYPPHAHVRLAALRQEPRVASRAPSRPDAAPERRPL